jgi:hypothetical protein
VNLPLKSVSEFSKVEAKLDAKIDAIVKDMNLN